LTFDKLPCEQSGGDLFIFIFFESIDASSEIHDAFLLANLLEKIINEIEKDKVVQVITDNRANYKAAGRTTINKRKNSTLKVVSS
jgi:hypothetical protein